MLVMKRGTKRGLSDVVTTVLIILLVLAAVAIIWGYLRGSLVQSGQQISGATSCLGLDLKVKSCKVAAGSATVVYERGSGSGDANLTKVTVLIIKADGTTVSSPEVPAVGFAAILNPAESKTVTVSDGAIVVATASSNSAVVGGTVVTASGSSQTCGRSDPVVCS